MEDLFGPAVVPSSSTPALETVVAIFDFEAQEGSDLGFKKGEQIEVLKREGDWWTGRIGTREGNFPFNYVKKPETMDASDPLAQAFQDDSKLIEKVTGSDGPVDLQKILGKEEESVLEQEARLQNERIANSAGLVQQNDGLFDLSEPVGKEATKADVDGFDFFNSNSTAEAPKESKTANAFDSFMDMGTTGGVNIMSQQPATTTTATDNNFVGLESTNTETTNTPLSFDNFGATNMPGFSDEKEQDKEQINEMNNKTSSGFTPDLDSFGSLAPVETPVPQPAPEPTPKVEEESTPGASIAPPVMAATPAVPSLAPEPIKVPGTDSQEAMTTSTPPPAPVQAQSLSQSAPAPIAPLTAATPAPAPAPAPASVTAKPSLPAATPVAATPQTQKAPAAPKPATGAAAIQKTAATPTSQGIAKPAPKPTKIADQLGLEFDDGGSTELVTFAEKPREYIEMVVNALPSRVFVAVLIIMDIILTIMDLAKPEKSGPDQAAFDWISFLTGLVFVADVAGRIFAYGFERYFGDPWEAADFTIVCVTFSVSVAMLALESDEHSTNWLKVVTFLRVLRIFRLVRLISSGTGAARQQVGQNKRRYQKDGFDLDLTYITDQCIAMSFPSEGRTAMFRNPMGEVARFMKTKHPGHYYVWNLCAERGYESHWFEQRCGRLLVDDHNVPKLKELVDWADQVKLYTAESKENVLVVHCKGGKGRTGTCIATWMLATDFLKTADLALRHFGERRTDDRKGKAFQGVETPSQSRYVNYYEKIKYNGWPVVRKIEIKAFTIQNISPIGRGNGSCIFFKIFNYGKEVFFGNVADQHNVTCAVDRQLDRATIHLKTPLVVKDDIKFMFYSSEKSVPRNYEDCGFYFWLHTGFFPASGNLTLARSELDNPHKSKTWSTFTDGFSCTVHFSIMP